MNIQETSSRIPVIVGGGGGGTKIANKSLAMLKRDVEFLRRGSEPLARELQSRIIADLYDTNRQTESTLQAAGAPPESFFLVGPNRLQGKGADRNAQEVLEALEESWDDIKNRIDRATVMLAKFTFGKFTGANIAQPICEYAQKQNKLVLPSLIVPSVNEVGGVLLARRAKDGLKRFAKTEICRAEIQHDKVFGPHQNLGVAFARQKIDRAVAFTDRIIYYLVLEGSEMDERNMAGMFFGRKRFRTGFCVVDEQKPVPTQDADIKRLADQCTDPSFYAFEGLVGRSILGINLPPTWPPQVAERVLRKIHNNIREQNKGKSLFWTMDDQRAYDPHVCFLTVPPPYGIVGIFTEYKEHKGSAPLTLNLGRDISGLYPRIQDTVLELALQDHPDIAEMMEQTGPHVEQTPDPEAVAEQAELAATAVAEEKISSNSSRPAVELKPEQSANGNGHAPSKNSSAVTPTNGYRHSEEKPRVTAPPIGEIRSLATLMKAWKHPSKTERERASALVRNGGCHFEIAPEEVKALVCESVLVPMFQEMSPAFRATLLNKIGKLTPDLFPNIRLVTRTPWYTGGRKKFEALTELKPSFQEFQALSSSAFDSTNSGAELRLLQRVVERFGEDGYGVCILGRKLEEPTSVEPDDTPSFLKPVNGPSENAVH